MNATEKPAETICEKPKQKEGKELVSLLKKLHTIQGKVEKMEKDGFNDFNKYKYLTETQVTIKMKRLLDEVGVMFTFGSEVVKMEDIGQQTGVVVRITYRFWDIDTGCYIENIVDGIGADKGDKGVYKGMTGAIKYIYMKTFNIPTGDDPENEKTPVKEKVKNTENVTKLKNKLVQLGAKNVKEAVALLFEKTGVDWKNFDNVKDVDASVALAKLLNSIK